MSEEEKKSDYSEPELKLRDYFIKRINRAYKEHEEFSVESLAEKSTEYLQAFSDHLDLLDGREGIGTTREEPTFFKGVVNQNGDPKSKKKLFKKKNKKAKELNISILEAFDKRFTHNSRVNKFGKQAEILRLYQGPRDRVGRLL